MHPPERIKNKIRENYDLKISIYLTEIYTKGGTNNSNQFK